MSTPKPKLGESLFEVCYQNVRAGKNKGGNYSYRKFAATSPTGAELKWLEWASRRKTSFRLVEIVKLGS